MKRKKVEPGSFHDEDGQAEKILAQALVKDTKEDEQTTSVPKLEYSRGLIGAYTTFRDQVYNPKSVLYPSCGFDGSPSRVFGNVTYVDLADSGNPGCIKAMQDQGFKAFQMDIRDYKPQESHDLLLLINPAIQTQWATGHIAVGAYIISNNYHGNASFMMEHPGEFALVGTLDEQSRKNAVSSYSTDLTDLEARVKDEVELRQYRPDLYEMFSFLIPGAGIDISKGFDKAYHEYAKLIGINGYPHKRAADLYVFIFKSGSIPCSLLR
jgi:hypothetical protein